MQKRHQKITSSKDPDKKKDTNKGVRAMTYRMPHEVDIALQKYSQKFKITTDTGAINHCILNSASLIESNNNLSMLNFELQGKINELEELIIPLRKSVKKLLS